MIGGRVARPLQHRERAGHETERIREGETNAAGPEVDAKDPSHPPERPGEGW